MDGHHVIVITNCVNEHLSLSCKQVKVRSSSLKDIEIDMEKITTKKEGFLYTKINVKLLYFQRKLLS